MGNDSLSIAMSKSVFRGSSIMGGFPESTGAAVGGIVGKSRRDRIYTASFSSLAGRNAIFLLALILIASPVAGFRPILAARFSHLEDAEADQAVRTTATDRIHRSGT